MMKPKIDPKFWSDHEVEQLSPEAKLTLLWLITNKTTSHCGVSEVSAKRWSYETGIEPKDRFNDMLTALDRFIVRSGTQVFIKNYIRHQLGKGEKLQSNSIFPAVVNSVNVLKDETIREAIIAEYPEITRKWVEEKDIYVTERGILDYLNAKAGRKFSYAYNNLSPIANRLKDCGRDVDGIKKMIDRQVSKWLPDPKMVEYLRPETLFNATKFRAYYDDRDTPLPKTKPNYTQYSDAVKAVQRLREELVYCEAEDRSSKEAELKQNQEIVESWSP